MRLKDVMSPNHPRLLLDWAFSAHLGALRRRARAERCAEGASPPTFSCVPAAHRRRFRIPVTPHESPSISLDDRLRQVETELIRWALEVGHGNKSRAAELLQIKRSTLGDRIKRCGLEQGTAAETRQAVPA
jgi:DNA-binding NtrC family response regulator